MTTTTASQTTKTKTKTKSVIKQLYINKLDTPKDLQSLIKDFCFYDTKTWEIMQFIKSKKTRIHHLLNTSCISRANPDDLFPLGADTEEHWVFYVYNEDDGENSQLQANNCCLCGEYKLISVNYPIPEKIKCKCMNHDITINNLVFDEDDIDTDYDYHSSDDDSFDD
jgi:hypothetical protein